MTLEVQIVSPERILWSGEAEMVTARTIEGGELAFLTDHAAFLGAVDIGKVIVRPEQGDDLLLAVHGGFVEVSQNQVSILSDVAETADMIDVERAREAKARAEEALRQDADDDEARAALRRADVRLEVAGVAVS
ncbi:MAG: atpC [Acidimicrobiales bacterium]|nr:atpC [Acidimicrobiales bacterium]